MYRYPTTTKNIRGSLYKTHIQLSHKTGSTSLLYAQYTKRISQFSTPSHAVHYDLVACSAAYKHILLKNFKLLPLVFVYSDFYRIYAKGILCVRPIFRSIHDVLLLHIKVEISHPLQCYVSF
jgi:hypothetical protein